MVVKDENRMLSELLAIDHFKMEVLRSKPKVPGSEPSPTQSHIAGIHSLPFSMLVQCKPYMEPQIVANTKL